MLSSLLAAASDTATTTAGRDWLSLLLSAPLLVLLGTIIKIVYDRIKNKEELGTKKKAVEVSETEAETHAFQAIIEAMQMNMNALTNRTAIAERRADAIEKKADAALERVSTLENEKHEMVDHIVALEHLVPNPPGPPARPTWS
jgi:hypothetical protein